MMMSLVVRPDVLVNHGHLGCASARSTPSLSLRQSTRYVLDLVIVGNTKHLAGG